MNQLFQQRIEAARRLAILCALYFGFDYRLSVRELRHRLEASGYSVGLDRLRADLSWLEETGLVSDIAASPRLTDRGMDVVFGRVRAAGVRHPEPGELSGFDDHGAS